MNKSLSFDQFRSDVPLTDPMFQEVGAKDTDDWHPAHYIVDGTIRHMDRLSGSVGDAYANRFKTPK